MRTASTDAASAHAFMFLSQENGLAFQRRTRFGSLTTHTGGGVGAAPVWVRLTRSGDLVTAATSLDGVVWTEVDHDIVSFGAGSVLVGLALTGHNDAALAHATLDHVSLLP